MNDPHKLPKIRKLVPKSYVDFKKALESVEIRRGDIEEINKKIKPQQDTSEIKIGIKRFLSPYNPNSERNQDSYFSKNYYRCIKLYQKGTLDRNESQSFKKNFKSNDWNLKYFNYELKEMPEINQPNNSLHAVRKGLVGFSVSNLYRSRAKVKNSVSRFEKLPFPI